MWAVRHPPYIHMSKWGQDHCKHHRHLTRRCMGLCRRKHHHHRCLRRTSLHKYLRHQADCHRSRSRSLEYQRSYNHLENLRHLETGYNEWISRAIYVGGCKCPLHLILKKQISYGLAIHCQKRATNPQNHPIHHSFQHDCDGHQAILKIQMSLCHHHHSKILFQLSMRRLQRTCRQNGLSKHSTPNQWAHANHWDKDLGHQPRHTNCTIDRTLEEPTPTGRHRNQGYWTNIL